MTGCRRQAQYLAAVADGELRLVPPETARHLAGCPHCRRELEVQRLLKRRLREAVLRTEDGAPSRLYGRRTRPGRARGWWPAVALVVAAALASAGLAGTRLLAGEDRVAAAIAVAAQPPQYRSADGSSIASWCRRTAGRPMPEVELSELSPVGARMDSRAGAPIVTVTYRTDQGGRVSVSWLDASAVAPGSTAVQARTVSGRTVLVVSSRSGQAVVSGDVPMSRLWNAAGEIESRAVAAA